MQRQYYIALTPEDEAHVSKCLEHQKAFEDAIAEKQTELLKDNQDRSISQEYDDMCAIINHAISTLPDVPKTSHFAREVSKRTKALFAERVKMGKRKIKQKQNLKTYSEKFVNPRSKISMTGCKNG